MMSLFPVLLAAALVAPPEPAPDAPASEDTLAAPADIQPESEETPETEPEPLEPPAAEPASAEPPPPAPVVVAPEPPVERVAEPIVAAPPPAEEPAAPSSAPLLDPGDVYDGGVSWKFGRNDQHALRLLTWHQIWNRYTQMNPGSQVSGRDRTHQYDVGLRRARMLFIGQLTDRFQVLTHFGINNQTFNNARKPQMYVHEATAQIDVVENVLSVGGGLHYWNGLSRLSNASTLTFMGLDAPILNWPTIERSDQFARKLGTYVKGKLGKFDYRFAVNKPFVPGVTVPDDAAPPVGAADYNPFNNTVELQGYGVVQLLEQEGNAVPYFAGTYLGTKKVFNVGGGFLWHRDGMWSADAAGQTYEHDIMGLSADVFADLPLRNRNGAVTAYGVYYYYDFGPNHLRNIGIMNVASGGTSANGAGNAYPTIGSGHHVFGQLGYMLPQRWMKMHRLQPYVSAQLSVFEALANPAAIPEAGLNWHLLAHHLKFTATYRNRPVYAVARDGSEPEATQRRSEIILQTQLAF